QEHENPSLKGCPVAKPLLHLEHLSPLGCFAQEVFRRLGAELEFPLLYIDLKKAYRRLAHTYHPDTGTHTDPMAFHNLQDAFEILGEEFTKTQTASPLGKKAA
ncbi:MAG: J domain-containing protein, partial [Bdellovibrionales bacterium]|nr:J domain-containing protein [Bdellovibrionales bacterium]